MATPPLSVINQWQLALDNGPCRRLSPAWRRVIRSMRPCTSRRWRWWLIHVHGLQMTGSGSLRARENGAMISAALREILQRTGMLENSANIVLAGDVVSPSAKKRAQPRRAVCTIASWWRALSALQAMQGLGADGVIGQSTRDWLNVSSDAARWRAGAEHSASTSAARQPSTGIMVNIPAFSLVYYQDGSRVLACAGDRRTSGPQDADDEQRAEQRSGQSAVERTAPTLARKDILPKVRE